MIITILLGAAALGLAYTTYHYMTQSEEITKSLTDSINEKDGVIKLLQDHISRLESKTIQLEDDCNKHKLENSYLALEVAAFKQQIEQVTAKKPSKKKEAVIKSATKKAKRTYNKKSV